MHPSKPIKHQYFIFEKKLKTIIVPFLSFTLRGLPLYAVNFHFTGIARNLQAVFAFVVTIQNPFAKLPLRGYYPEFTSRLSAYFHLKIMIPTIATAMPTALRHSQGCFSTPNHPNNSMIYATASWAITMSITALAGPRASILRITV